MFQETNQVVVFEDKESDYCFWKRFKQLLIKTMKEKEKIFSI